MDTVISNLNTWGRPFKYDYSISEPLSSPALCSVNPGYFGVSHSQLCLFNSSHLLNSPWVPAPCAVGFKLSQCSKLRHLLGSLHFFQHLLEISPSLPDAQWIESWCLYLSISMFMSISYGLYFCHFWWENKTGPCYSMLARSHAKHYRSTVDRISLVPSAPYLGQIFCIPSQQPQIHLLQDKAIKAIIYYFSCVQMAWLVLLEPKFYY